MVNHITINGRKIGREFSPYIIAEMSANHNGDIENAYKILKLAKECGADALKLQTYTPDTLTLDCDKDDFKIKGGLWEGRSLYDLYAEAHMPWEWHKLLFERAKDIGITIFSSPFDFTAVDLLEELQAPAYKIASFEAIDIPLIEYVARTGKPMIISTGMASAEEIQEAVTAARNAGCTELVILHCVSGYPASSSDYNLATIPDMAERFDVLVGLSDHTIDNTTAIASVALGACVIEKHVTLDRNAGGPDDSFSLEKPELMQLCRDSKTAWTAFGAINYELKTSEKGNMVFRRSIYVVKDIKLGDRFTAENIRCIRPGYGLAPKFLYNVIGKRAVTNIDRGTALNSEHIEAGWIT
ncbi:pseudaminic acid synthase [Pseudomonadales bacterium]|nr:pseudaminic acid synthase [Pseudomonadales bacterium]